MRFYNVFCYGQAKAGAGAFGREKRLKYFILVFLREFRGRYL